MQLSLFSISYAGLWGQQRLGLEEFIAKASELGYSGVMLAGKRPHLSVLDWDDEAIPSLRAALDEHAVACTAVAGYTDFSRPAAPEVPVLEMQIDYVGQLARLARALGGSIVRVFTAYEADGEDATASWRRVVTALREAADRAAEYQIMLAVQNHHDVALHTDALLELVSDVDRPNCRLGFDAWSPALRGEDLPEAARKAAPYTVMTTNADYVRLPRFRYRPEVVNYQPAEPPLVRAVPFGTGFIDFQAFFSALREGGFDGPAHYEMCSPLRGGGSLENLDHCARTYVQWMQEHGFAS